jgi:hypothetical protein
MGNLSRLLTALEVILFIEFSALDIVSEYVYGDIFNRLSHNTFIALVILSVFANKVANPKYKKSIIFVTLVIIITLPILIMSNLPRYKYKEAVEYIGQIKRNQGTVSFKYNSEGWSSNYNALNKNFLTMKDYCIEADIDGEPYFYNFNPYTAEFKEEKIQMLKSEFEKLKEKEKYRTLY